MPTAPSFVLDSSVALSWCFKDEQDPYGDSVLVSLKENTAVVPAIWPLEVGNALLMAERRTRSSESNTAERLYELAALPIEIDAGHAVGSLPALLALARAQNLTTYDASYLQLATTRRLPLATLDRRLKDAAAAIGVQLYRVSGG